MREGKSNKQISFETRRHRNTVSRYVNYIQRNNVYDFQQIANEIIDTLHSRLDAMTDKDLIAFLSRMIPQKFESKHEYREIKLSWNIDDSSTTDKVSAAHRAAELSRE